MALVEELRKAAEWFEQSPPPDPATMPRKPINRMFRDAADEIQALSNFLEIALDDYDSRVGFRNPESYPNAWDVQARKRLEGLEK